MLFEVKYLVMFVTLFLFSRMTYPKSRLRHVENMSISENIENAGYGLFIFSTSVLLLLFTCIYVAYNFALNKLTIFRDEEQYTYFPISLERSSVLETHSWPLYVNRLCSAYAQTHFFEDRCHQLWALSAPSFSQTGLCLWIRRSLDSIDVLLGTLSSRVVLVPRSRIIACRPSVGGYRC